ncbi:MULTISPECIES: hypothetical protein [Pseudomonas]|uniref:Uncharacterized protein n=1 Tax=Pseudomonas fluorescens TaxID=294 RepID=A0A166QRR7_PSEFL|nr:MULTISPECIES: hypothetical protein [Pseudomonas]KZN20755.1 hypothetical protein A1D17_04210 [Pseudomonas fluorescens]
MLSPLVSFSAFAEIWIAGRQTSEFFGECPDSILKVFQSACDVTLTETQAVSAKAAGLAVAKEGRPTVGALVERWSSMSELKEFAAAVTRTMLLG